MVYETLMPACFAKKGISLFASCSCKATVALDTTNFFPNALAITIAGNK